MDFSKIKPDFRKEIVRGGEAYLDGQVKIAASADSRASSLAGMYTAAATALTAGVAIAVYNAAGTALHERLPLVIAGGAAAISFITGALFCVTAIQPVGFYLPGCEPDNWEEDVTKGKELDDCLGERALHIQSHINANFDVIKENARRFTWGARFGMAAPFVGIFVGMIAWAAARWSA
ncbi:hypothetical protein [Bradyrhizobium glycinis]|uniref:hypothetical protein n=1 Tax=Bradyrhizobium glycinis TaxID=2751812 RepID=UPI0018D8A112|nr:hypothetical protein [Bradyrhizobium glycinis]MBH5373502.1 hypothetical protein [Bradyrhizobium glycinis]